MTHITMQDKGKNFFKNNKVPFWVILLWIALWHFLSLYIDQQILLASPLSVVESLFSLVQQYDFWVSIGFSMARISMGFILGTTIGTLFAVVSYKVLVFKQIISPLILFSKSVPVASFIIVMLIWISPDNISIFVSLIMVLPIVYTNVLSGIQSLNSELSEMSKLFEITKATKIRYIVIPQIMPYFKSACLVGLGLSFKAGIAAEVIGVPDLSIGEHLYQAKIFLDTPSLFAWTAVIIFASFLFEKIFIKLISVLEQKLESVRLR